MNALTQSPNAANLSASLPHEVIGFCSSELSGTQPQPMRFFLCATLLTNWIVLMKNSKNSKTDLAKDPQQKNLQNNTSMVAHQLPVTGFVRDWQIVGSRAKGVIGVLPIGRTAWWEGVRTGKYPPGVKLSQRTTAWPVESIRRLIAELGGLQ